MSSTMPLFAVGASAGGVTVLQILLDKLAPEFKAPLCVVQHLPANSLVDVSNVYGSSRARPVVGIEDKMPIEEGHVYFAPGGYHLSIERGRTFALSQEEPVHFSRPSIDVFFESAAEVYGSNLVAALLTGANADGARGLKRVKDAGGVTIVQDPKDAEFSTMPESALKLFQPDYMVTANNLSKLFAQLFQRGLKPL